MRNARSDPRPGSKRSGSCQSLRKTSCTSSSARARSRRTSDREPEGRVAVAAVDLGQRRLPEPGDGDDERRVARFAQVRLHHPEGYGADRPRRMTQRARWRIRAFLPRSGVRGDEAQALAGRPRWPRRRGARRRAGSGARRSGRVPRSGCAAAIARAMSRIVWRSPDATLYAPGAASATVSAATFARATSVTCTKSRSCPPSSNTCRRTPGSSALRKMLATPAYGVSRGIRGPYTLW